jgi:Mg2+/Co2+ transporter CorC
MKMQSKDESGNIKQLTAVDLSKVIDLAEKIKSAEEKGAVSHTIAKLPKANEQVEINGLSYRVEFADFVKGKFRLKLVLRDK